MTKDSSKNETPEEFRKSMIQVYGDSHWQVMKNFILNGSDPVEFTEEDSQIVEDFEEDEEGEEAILDALYMAKMSPGDEMAMVNDMIEESLSDAASIEAF